VIGLLMACCVARVDAGQPPVTIEPPSNPAEAAPSPAAIDIDALLPVPTVWIGVDGNFFSPLDAPLRWSAYPVLDLVRSVDPSTPERFPEPSPFGPEGHAAYMDHGFAEQGDIVPGRWRFWWTHSPGVTDIETWEVDLRRGTASRTWQGPMAQAPDWVQATGPRSDREELPAEDAALAGLSHLPWWTVKQVLSRYAGDRATLPGWRAAVQELLTSPDPAIRAAALRWARYDLASEQRAASEQLPSWRPLVRSALDDPVPRVRAWAASLAVSSSDPELVVAAAPLRCDDHPLVRRTVVSGLAPFLSREQLAPHLLDPDAGVSLVAGRAWDDRPWPDPAVARALLARSSRLDFLFEDALTLPFPTETLRRWQAEGISLWTTRLPDRGASLAEHAQACTTLNARIARDRLQQERFPEAAEVEARCAGWPDIAPLIAEIEPCAPPEPPTYTVDLWSPALASGPVQLRLLDVAGQPVAEGRLPTAPSGSATLRLQPSGLPRTLELRQGGRVDRRLVPASFGVRVQALCEDATAVVPPDDLLPWVARGLREPSCKDALLSRVEALPDDALLPLIHAWPDLLPGERRRQVIAAGLDGGAPAAALAELARLPCDERLALVEARPQLDLGEAIGPLIGCANASVDAWLRVDDLRRAGRVPSALLTVAHSEDARVRTRIAQRLVAAVGTDDEPAAAALVRALDDRHPSASLANLLPLEPGATAYAAALLLPTPCLGSGAGTLTLVDELLILEPRPDPAVPQVLLLDPEQAQARMLVCGALVLWLAR